MSRSMLTIVGVLSWLFLSITASAQKEEQELCQGQGACQTKHIVRKAGETKFTIFGIAEFKPFSTWKRSSITEDDYSVRFLYEAPAYAGEPAYWCVVEIYHNKRDLRADLELIWKKWVVGPRASAGEHVILVDPPFVGRSSIAARTAITQARNGTRFIVELLIYEHFTVISDRNVPGSVATTNYYPFGAGACSARSRS